MASIKSTSDLTYWRGLPSSTACQPNNRLHRTQFRSCLKTSLSGEAARRYLQDRTIPSFFYSLTTFSNLLFCKLSVILLKYCFFLFYFNHAFMAFNSIKRFVRCHTAIIAARTCATGWKVDASSSACSLVWQSVPSNETANRRLKRRHSLVPTNEARLAWQQQFFRQCCLGQNLLSFRTQCSSLTNKWNADGASAVV